MITTAEPSFTFDGTYMKTMGIFLNEVKVSPPEISRVSQDVPGRIGDLNFGNNIGARAITLEVTLSCKTQDELNDRKLYLNNLVITDAPSEKPLVLDTDSLWTYYGQFTEMNDYELINGYTEKVTLTFTCSVPYKYGRQIDTNISSNVHRFTPLGQQKTYPIFSAIAKRDTTWCGLSTTDQFLYIGGKVNVETGEIATTLYSPVLTDTAQNMSLWQRQSPDTFKQVANGTVGKGSYFQQANDDINVKDYGTNEGKASEWYGPALKRMLTKQLANFKVTFRIQAMNRYKRAEGKIELYLLDSASNVIGKLGIKDNGEGSEQEINIQIMKSDGTYKTVGQFKPTVKNSKTVALNKKQKVKKTDSKGKVTYTYVTLKETINENNSTNDFTDFYGNLILEKVGNQFYASVVKLDTKTRNEIGNWSAMWTDTTDVFKKDLAGFVLYAGKRAITEDKNGIDYKDNYLSFCHLVVEERTQIVQEEIISTSPEIIIYEGDELVFNCETGRVYKNGQLFMDAMHIGSQFTELIGGVSEEIVFAEDFTWTMHYRPTAY